MRFETFVALRYLRSKRKNRFVSLITIISVAGVSVGVIALIVVMSVMTGFDEALRDTIIGNRAHLVVQDPLIREMYNYEEVTREVAAVAPEMVAASPFVQIQSLMVAAKGGATSPCLIVGVDPQLEQNVTELADNLTDKRGRKYGRGELPEKSQIVIGYLLADNIGVTVGDWVDVLTEKPSQGLLGPMMAKPIRLQVSGISQAQMSDWDMGYGFVNLETARKLSGRDGVDGIHLKLEDPNDAARVSDRVKQKLGYYTETWYQNQQAFFQALEQEKLAMFIILVFIILVAAFNITSTLIMIVMEKRRDIGILRTIGSSSRSVLTLFVIEGLLIGLSGTVFGVVIGTWLAYNLNPVVQIIAHVMGLEGELFNSQIYYFDRIPVAVVWQDVAKITLASIALSFLSTIYPAWSASRLDPVDALRYE
jgi:lipoprotein-releasing system permease protein